MVMEISEPDSRPMERARTEYRKTLVYKRAVHALLWPAQHGCQKQRSCPTDLLRFLDEANRRPD